MKRIEMIKKKETPFIGRQREMGLLKRLVKKRVASLVVIKGRRRIGKSRLAEEFGKEMERIVVIAGIPPEDGVNAQDQRNHFATQVGMIFNAPRPRAEDWGELFWALADRCQTGRTLIVLDEITWLGSKDTTFLGKLKNAWDQHFKKNSELVLIITGSVSSWIDRNILSSTGFVGRISLDIKLEELPLYQCNEFWRGYRKRVSSYEKFQMLAVTGGVPRYLEEIFPEESSVQQVFSLCFQREGLLFNEFERIFSDLFASRSNAYRAIVEALVGGPVDQERVCQVLGMKKGGTVTEYLSDLEQAGFVAREFTWHLHSGKQSKLSRYRLRDNYLSFYLKYIAPNKRRIELGSYAPPSAGWSSIFGLQFENLVLNNRKTLWEALKINPGEIVYDNPHFQRATTRQRGCQIDYLIQMRDNILWICEIKFSKNLVGLDAVKEMEEKIARLSIPKRFSYRTVLIHVNGISESLEESDYFSSIVDFSQFLEPPMIAHRS